MPLLRPLHPGQSLAGYELGECLAEGAIVSTWSATEVSSGTRVALKTIPLASLDDADSEDVLLEHAALAKAVQGPGVARLLAFGRDAGTVFLAYEWVDGVELAALLKLTEERGLLPRGIALRIVADFCGTLSTIHQAGLIHQAISPGNAIISADGQLKLLGLGVGVLHRASSATTFRHMVGKFSYLSPEQLWSRPVEASSDLFSLGMIFFEMLAGHHPFRGRNDRETTAKILSPAEAQIPDSLRPSLPSGVEACLLRALRKAPAERFASAEEMRIALLGALGDAYSLASSADVLELCRSWCPPEVPPSLPAPVDKLALPPAAPSGNPTQELPALRIHPGPSRGVPWVFLASFALLVVLAVVLWLRLRGRG